MFLRQVYDPQLAQYAYVVGCQRTGEAIVIDPERDIDRYQAIAAGEGLRITAVAETHIHADFVSGARELAVADPSIEVYVSAEGGPNWQSDWVMGRAHVHLLKDGDSFRVGNLKFQAIHTPGHTPEHMVYLVTDLGGGATEPMAMFSGDFLFVGDAGRPDLLEQAAGQAGTQEPGARQLYSSLRKVASLPCHLQILPAHGAGSACGKALGSVPTSTFGYEMQVNPALKLALAGNEQAFVDFILSGQPEPPAYFANMKHVNKVGPAFLGGLPQPPILSVEQVAARLEESGFVVVDTRKKEDFFSSHLRRSLLAPASKFADFAGSYLAPEDEVVLVLDDPQTSEDWVRQLVRMGFDRIVGILPASALSDAPREAMVSSEVAKFADWNRLAGRKGARILDVRKSTEYSQRHLVGAQNIAHTRLRPRLAEVSSEGVLLVHCQSGLRAAGASAFLERMGRKVICVADSFDHAPQDAMN